MRNSRALIILLCLSLLSSCSLNKAKPDVYILGTIHANHLISDLSYTLKDLEKTLAKVNPDMICIEMTEGSLNSDMEGYFPPENAVMIEYARSNNIPIVAIDWRPDFDKEIEDYQLSDEHREQLKTARNNVERLSLSYLMENNWEGYFDFIHTDSAFHAAIKQQHDLKIELLGEESDGYWLTRNKEMADNIIKGIEKNDPKVVLVTAGLHHNYILTDLLASKHSVKLKKVPSLAKSENTELSHEVVDRWHTNRDKLQLLVESDTASAALKTKIKQSHRLQELDMLIQAKGKANKEIRHLFEK